jgi:hypothetical protein
VTWDWNLLDKGFGMKKFIYKKPHAGHGIRHTILLKAQKIYIMLEQQKTNKTRLHCFFWV